MSPLTIDPTPLEVLVGVLVVFVGPYLSMFINILRLSFDMPREAPPLIALVSGLALSLITILACAPATPVLMAVAISVFVAIVVAGQAIGVAQLHDSANNVVGDRRARKALLREEVRPTIRQKIESAMTPTVELPAKQRAVPAKKKE